MDEVEFTEIKLKGKNVNKFDGYVIYIYWKIAGVMMYSWIRSSHCRLPCTSHEYYIAKTYI